MYTCIGFCWSLPHDMMFTSTFATTKRKKLQLCFDFARKLNENLAPTLLQRLAPAPMAPVALPGPLDAQEECSWSSDSSGRREGQINLSQPKKSIKILISYNSNFDLSQDFLRFKGLRGWEFWRRADGVEAIDPSRWYKCWIMLEYEV